MTRDARIRAMVDGHYDLVWRTLRRLGVPESALDDATQQVFLVGARRIDIIRQGEEGGYLVGITVRVASEVRRKARRNREQPTQLDTSAPHPAPSPEELLDRKRMRAHFDLVLDAMPESLRVAFVLFEVEGMTRSEVSRALDVPEGTVASRLRRAREHFRSRVARIFSLEQEVNHG